MSGGSFNYIGSRPLDEAIRCDDFDRMIGAVAAHPDGARAALELRSIQSAFDALEARWLALEGVMHEVEWHRSGDIGPERVAEALVKYNATADAPSDADHDASYSRAASAMDRLAVEFHALAPKEAR